MLIALCLFLIALAAAGGLGFQIGLRRGIHLAALHAEEEAIVATIIRTIQDDLRI